MPAGTPVIQCNGSLSGTGTAGIDREDLIIGQTLTFLDTNAGNSGASYVWSLDDIPIGSAASLTGPTTASPTSSPDVTGTIRIKCIVNGTFSAMMRVAVDLPNTKARIPSYNEGDSSAPGGTWNGSSDTKGWQLALTTFMRAADAALGSKIGTGWAANKVNALALLAGLDTSKCSVSGGEVLLRTDWIVTGTWAPPTTGIRGGALQTNDSSAASLKLNGDGTNPQLPTKLGGTGYGWGMSMVFALQGSTATNAFSVFSISTNANPADPQGIQVGYNQGVNATKFVAYFHDGSGVGTVAVSTISLDTAFHAADLWYNATTDKYFVSIDDETAIEVLQASHVPTKTTACTPMLAVSANTALKPDILNRWVMVSGSEV